jgi:hypothetical protein
MRQPSKDWRILSFSFKLSYLRGTRFTGSAGVFHGSTGGGKEGSSLLKLV